MEDNGKLTTEEVRKAIAWVNQRAPQLTCPSCGTKQFSIAEHMVSPPLFIAGGMQIGGPAYPMFILICQHCGHAMHYSAVQAGLVEPKAGK